MEFGASARAAAVDTTKLPPPSQQKVDFAHDIKPIFEASCFRCHGPERPRSRFRLDNREAALKGGENGIAIVPGDSAKSPLIHYVARLPEVEDLWMPPAGKDEPLTAEQVSLLRAWIDQGVPYAETAAAPQPEVAFSITPAFRWITVSGDQARFREHFWMKDGLHAGIESFTIRQQFTNDSTVDFETRIFPADEDYRAAIRYERRDIGFVSAGFEHYRKYYDDSGGFYPFAQPVFSLDPDLELRSGKAWADFGLILPEWPKVAVGYEYQFRQGEKSTLQWGEVRAAAAPVLPDTAVRRSIYPAFKEIDEKVHIIKLDMNHEAGGVFFEDNFRAEFYDLKTSRENALSVVEGQILPSRSVLVDEAHDQFRAVNAFRLEKEVRSWWFLSGGYLYSKADADASFRQNTVHATGLPISGDFWRSHSIILSQDSVLLNANTRLGPWENFTVSGGVQSDWMHQEGLGRVSLDTGNPAVFLLMQPATLDANLNRHTLQESLNARFTGLPFTSVFADVRLEQETLNTIEEQIGTGENFLQDTEADSNLKDWRAGFYSSPLNTISIGGHYRRRKKFTDYHHTIDITEGYPAFIEDRRIITDEFEARLTWRPFTWMKTSLTYQLVDTDFDSTTDEIAGVTPGGRLRAGSFNANIYGVNLILTPFPRWYFSGTLNYYDSRASSADNVPSIVAYRGDIYSVLASSTYNLSTNTDLTASYSFSKANYGQDNFAQGLPLGIDYDWHIVQTGLTRRLKWATTNVRYVFYKYAEPGTGGFNDYTAHAVFATMTLFWH